MAKNGGDQKKAIDKIMHSHHFNRGWKDYVAGLGYPKEYDTWCGRDAANYERGRHFAAGTGGKIVVKHPGRKRVSVHAIIRADDMVTRKELV